MREECKENRKKKERKREREDNTIAKKKKKKKAREKKNRHRFSLCVRRCAFCRPRVRPAWARWRGPRGTWSGTSRTYRDTSWADTPLLCKRTVGHNGTGRDGTTRGENVSQCVEWRKREKERKKRRDQKKCTFCSVVNGRRILQKKFLKKGESSEITFAAIGNATVSAAHSCRFISK